MMKPMTIVSAVFLVGVVVALGAEAFSPTGISCTVDSDCNGTLSSVPAGLSQNFVVKENGCQVFFIVTAHPAGTATLSGEAVRISKSTD